MSTSPLEAAGEAEEVRGFEVVAPGAGSTEEGDRGGISRTSAAATSEEASHG